MISLSPKQTDVVTKQQELVDWLRAGGKLTPVAETLTDWALPPMKKAMTAADTAASTPSAKSIEHFALLVAAVTYRDSLHAMAGRQEIKGAAVRRSLRNLTILTADFAAMQGGKAYA